MDKIASPPLTSAEAQQLVAASLNISPAARALAFSLCREAINLAPLISSSELGQAAHDNAALLLHLAFDDSATPLTTAAVASLADRCAAIAVTRAGWGQY